MTTSARKTWRPVGIVLSVAAGLMLYQFGVAPAYAQDRHLDPAFGNGGKVRTNLGTANDVVNALAVQGTKIIAAGVTGTSLGQNFAVARYNANGTLDGTFGSGGKVVTDFGGADIARAVVVTGTTIVVAGVTQTTGGEDFALARYTSTGALDATFGTGGKVVTDLGDEEGAFGLATTGGKLIAAGQSASGDVPIAVYTSTGALDPAFSGDGKLLVDFAGDFDAAHAVLAGSGFFVVGGYATGPLDADFATIALDLTGTPIPGSKVTSDFGGDDVINALTWQGDKLVASGYTNRPTTKQDFATARYNTDHSLDKTFGSGGVAKTDFASDADAATGVVVDGTGLLVAGRSITAGREYFGLVRYTSTGARDTTFGTNGRATTGFAGDARANALVVHGTGFVAGGSVATTAGLDFGLARYVLAS